MKLNEKYERPDRLLQPTEIHPDKRTKIFRQIPPNNLA
jgi:hypothetical protein